LNNPDDYSGLLIYSPIGGKVFQEIISGKNPEIGIDVHHMPAGLYILYLQGPATLFSRKVIIRP
jgi:hypothetical protein